MSSLSNLQRWQCQNGEQHSQELEKYDNFADKELSRPQYPRSPICEMEFFNSIFQTLETSSNCKW